MWFTITCWRCVIGITHALTSISPAAYIYFVSALGLQAVAWAVIALARNLALNETLDPSVGTLAFQIALLVVALPFYLVHWLWGRRLAEREAEERSSALRRLYLYGLQAAFLGPMVANAFDLLGSLARLSSTLDRQPASLDTAQGIIYHLIPLVILAILYYYSR